MSAQAGLAPLRFGVLGASRFAMRRMLPALAELPGAALTAIASRDIHRAENAAAPYDATAVQGYEALLRRDDVDAVYVPLPASLHAQWAEAALRAGKHVLVEKPATTQPEHAARLVELAQGAGLALMENIMFVHHHQHAAVRTLVKDGRIGELRSFQAGFGIPRLAATDIRYAPELDGGALWDVGIYPLRAALHFLGHDLEVLGAHLTRGAHQQVDTAGAALLSTPSGITAQVAFGLDHGYRSFYELWGSEGRITVERVFTPPADHRPVIRLTCASGTEEIRLAPDDQTRNTLTAFIASAHSMEGPGRERETLLRQAKLLDLVREAGRDRTA